MAITTIREDTTERHVNKYNNQNPLHRLSLSRFYDAVADVLDDGSSRPLLDFGCGEGYVLDMMAARDVALPLYEGVDLRQDAIAAAQDGWPDKSFQCADLFDPKFDRRRYHTVMALEVFEHLFDPEKVLKRLASIAEEKILLTVPNEPWFQLMNLVRGRDLIRLGNHPEHIQHWNAKTFADLVSKHVEVVDVKTRFPFVILTGRPRG